MTSRLPDPLTLAMAQPVLGRRKLFVGALAGTATLAEPVVRAQASGGQASGIKGLRGVGIAEWQYVPMNHILGLVGLTRISDPQPNRYTSVRFESPFAPLPGEYAIETSTAARNGDVQPAHVPYDKGSYNCSAIPSFRMRFA